MQEILKNLIPEHKSMASKSMMSYHFENQGILSDFQLEMLKNNRIQGFLETQAIRINQTVQLSYDITSLIPLKKYLERKEIGRKEFRNLLNQMVSSIKYLENYLLDQENVVLDTNYIYISPSEEVLYLMYIPLTEKGNFNTELKALLTNLIMQDIRFKKEMSDNYIQLLIERLKAGDFGIDSLKSYIDEIAKQVESAPPAYVKDTGNAEVSVKVEAGTIPSINQTISQPQQNAIPKPPGQPKPVNNAPKSQMVQNTEKKLVFPTKSYVILGAAILVLVLLCLAMFLNGSFNSADSLTTVAGLLLVGGALLYLVYSKLFVADKKVEKIVTVKSKEVVQNTSPSQVTPPQRATYVNQAIRQPGMAIPPRETSVPVKGQAMHQMVRQPVPQSNQTPLKPPIPNSRPTQQSVQPSMQQMSVRPVQQPSQPVTNKNTDHTVLLAEANTKSPCLKRVTNGLSEQITIKKFPFMIGRMAEQVDYCMQNPAIGKLHAEINQKADGLYITDMNSRNGTFLNDKQLEGSIEFKLNHGDRIRLANEDFVFSENRI